MTLLKLYRRIMTQNATPTKEPMAFEAELAELEQDLQTLKHRHEEIELAQREQAVLQRERNELKAKGKNQPVIKQEMAQIRSRLAELDLILESKLLNLWEPFWQAVRFAGAGFVLGWMIRGWQF